MNIKIYPFICHFIPWRLKHGAPKCRLRGKEVLLRIVSEDFHKQERLMSEHPQWHQFYYHGYIDSRHDGVLLVRIDIDEVKQMIGVSLNDFIDKIAEKMEEKMIGRMFEGATISNSVVVGVAQSGAQVYYMPNKQEENPQKTENLQGKEAIIDYLDRLKPMVKAEYKDRYDTLWEGVLELNQVKATIYNKGKQQDTTFNRNLLAQIIHQLGVLYVPTANTVQMAMQLEPEKGADHPVRQKLGEVPEKTIKKAVDEYIKANLG